MKTATEYITMLRDYKQKHSSEYGIERMGIFGSVARGEQTENSDVDIYLESDTISLFRMGGLVYDLKELFNSPVDIVCKQDGLNPNFVQRIEKDIIYVL
jgi:predicted nucleotidyltransferase